MLAKLRSLSRKTKERIQSAAFFLPYSAVVLLMLYGVINWPYFMREVDGRFVDSAGETYSAEIYHRFVLWRICLLAAFAVLFASLALTRWILGLPPRFPSRRKTEESP